MSVALAGKPVISLDGESLTLDEVVAVSRDGAKVELTPHAKERVNVSRQFVEELIDHNLVAYGITTGFGKFSDVVISRQDSQLLQRNLIASHATGVGRPLEPEIVRAIMLLRANALAKGNSGIRLSSLQALIDLLNSGVIPVIPEKGSLGASGDLAPLSHLVLVLLGEGEAFWRGHRVTGARALQLAGLNPLTLAGKEGLALINGTQVMTAIGALAVWDAENLARAADIAGAMSLEALKGILNAFDPKVHGLRAHPGQVQVAENILRLTAGSGFVSGKNADRVQDPYTLRCIAQVHGPSRDAFTYARRVIETEINSATDNPLIFPADREVISGGNFHGQPVALVMDFLGIAAAELANISERRLERLVNPALSGLPPFLTPNGGLNSGFMIVQYSAASLVSENKVLAHPASVDSIPSSGNQEDHVSMGTIAARKARDILDNSLTVVAMELLAACQATDLRSDSKDKNLGKGTKEAYKLVRAKVKELAEDRVMYPDINTVKELVSSGKLVRTVSKKVNLH